MRRAYDPSPRALSRLCVAVALASACASSVPAAPPSEDAAAPVEEAASVDAGTDAGRDVGADVDPAFARGATVFRIFCARCHGARGFGSGDGPDLRVEVPTTTDEDIRRVLVSGGRRMPVVPIDDQERADVFTFLRATFGAYRGR